MSRAVFINCPDCGRYMLGQMYAGRVYPQPHTCPAALDPHPGDERAAGGGLG